MKRMSRVMLAFCLVFCAMCKNSNQNPQIAFNQKDSLFHIINDSDTLSIDVCQVNFDTRRYIVRADTIFEYKSDSINNSRISDSIKADKNQMLHYRSNKLSILLSNFFAVHNLSKPIQISDEWLKKAMKLNKKALSKSFINEAFQNDSEAVLHFTIRKVNLDEDDEPEIVLSFRHSDHTEVRILDKIGDAWYYQSTFDICFHWSEVEEPIIDVKNKLLIGSNEVWGSGISSYENDVYRFINGHLYRCLAYDQSSGVSSPWPYSNLESKYKIENDNSFAVDYKFSVYSLKSDLDKTKPDVYFIKDRAIRTSYKWNPKNYMYELKKVSDKRIVSADCININFIRDLYRSEIDSLRKFGTYRQRHAEED